MKTITKEYKIYKFNEAPREVKDKIIERLTYDGFLYEHCMQERIETLKEVARLLNGELDYSISCVPCRGEYIRIKPKYDELDFESLWDAINIEKDCPLTGVCYDHDIINLLNGYNLNVDALNEVLDEYIKSIHDEFESMCQDEYINDLCEANDYEFYESGEIY